MTPEQAFQPRKQTMGTAKSAKKAGNREKRETPSGRAKKASETQTPFRVISRLSRFQMEHPGV